MREIEVNGSTLPFNILDADIREKCDGEIKKLVAAVQDMSAYEGKTEFEGMRYQCRAVDAFFDCVFGAGTAEKIFGVNNDLEARLNGFSDVCAEYFRANERLEALKSRFGEIATGGAVTPGELTH